MDSKEITELIKLVSKSSLIELKIKDGDFEITMRTEKHGHSKHSKSEEKAHAVQMQQVPMQQAPIAPAPPVAQQAPAPAPTPADLASATAAAELSESYLEIKSPMVGTFYRSSSPDKPPYIKIGDEIQQGSVVCIIEAMKLFNEIESEITGKIVKVMVEDATPVEYDQVLFLVEK